MRGNKQIWRMAKWLWEEIKQPMPNYPIPWSFLGKETKNKWYDHCKKLNYALAHNTFTGPDNHEN